MKVFVYGTLKQGHGNWERLLRHRARFVGSAKTHDHFVMRCVGFPMIFPEPNGYRVLGQVFEVDSQTLASLDRLESEGYMYDRRLQLVEMYDGTDELCMLYVARGKPGGRGVPVAPEDDVLNWKGYRR